MRKWITPNWVRVDKKTARILYQTNRFGMVYMVPVNLNPESPFVSPYAPSSNDAAFEYTVEVFEHYNCINSETGRYTAFYVPRKWYDLMQEVVHGFLPTEEQLNALTEMEAKYQ